MARMLRSQLYGHGHVVGVVVADRARPLPHPRSYRDGKAMD